MHNGVYCKLKNWSTGKVLLFKDMLDGEGSEGVMSKDFKFDVVIGNPPYQEIVKILVISRFMIVYDGIL